MYLETERLILRQMDMGDIGDLAEMLEDQKVMYAYDHTFGDDETEKWLKRQMERYQKYGFGLLLSVRKSDMQVVGEAGLTMQPYGGGEVLEIGYHLKRRFWHMGYAAEAAKALRDYAFDILGHERVYAIIKQDNLASINVAKRAGLEVSEEFSKDYTSGKAPHYLFKAEKKVSNSPYIETPDLILRRFAPRDIPALHEILKDAGVNRFLPWYPTKNLMEAGEFLRKRYELRYGEKSGYFYAVCLKSDNIPIGYINAETEGAHDLGYGLRQDMWGKGIMRKAGKALIERLRQDGMDFVTATHDIGNVRSGRVMKALGMSYRYSYNELWQPKNIPVTFRMYQLDLKKGTDTYDGYMKKYGRFVENID